MFKYQDVVLAFDSGRLGYDNGTPIFRAQIRVEDQSGNPAQLYSDNGVTPINQPVLTDSSGNFSFFVADGLYDIITSDPFGMNPVRKSKVQIVDILAFQGAPAVIADGAVSNAKLAPAPANTLKGAVVNGGPVDLTPGQAAAIVQPSLVINDLQPSTVAAPSKSAVLSGLAQKANLTGPFAGNASTASALAASRTIAATGDVAYAVAFDGSANATGSATIAAKAVTNAKMADMPASTLKGAAVSGAPADLTPQQVAAIVRTPLLSATFLGQQDIEAAPAGNTGTTTASHVMQLTLPALASNKREFAQILSVTSNYGRGGTSGNDKVTSYRSFVANQGSADGWVDNILFHHVTGDPINTHLCEADYDMIASTQYGNDPGPNGLAGGQLADGTPFSGTSAHGYVVTGISVGPGYITSAYTAAAAGTNRLFSRGFSNGVGSKFAGFFDSSDSVKGFHATGVYTDAYATGDLNPVAGQPAQGLVTGAAFRMGHQQRFQAFDNNGTRRTLMYLTGNTLDIGHEDGISPTTTALSRFNSPVIPRVDNAYTLGQSAFRWSTIYASNGVIQTSDPTLKTNMRAITPAQGLRIALALKPIKFNWIVGGYDTETEMVEGDVEYADWEDDLDADGNPVIVRDAVVDEAGNIVRPAEVSRKQVIKTRKGEVPRLKQIPIEGKRQHWGWNAENVQSVFAKENEDFGGFAITEEGIKSLRPDQLIPVLCAAIQALAADVKKLKAKKSA